MPEWCIFVQELIDLEEKKRKTRRQINCLNVDAMRLMALINQSFPGSISWRIYRLRDINAFARPIMHDPRLGSSVKRFQLSRFFGLFCFTFNCKYWPSFGKGHRLFRVTGQVPSTVDSEHYRPEYHGLGSSSYCGICRAMCSIVIECSRPDCLHVSANPCNVPCRLNLSTLKRLLISFIFLLKCRMFTYHSMSSRWLEPPM